MNNFDSLGHFICLDNEHYEGYLTLGNSYELFWCRHPDHVTVENNRGRLVNVFRRRFSEDCVSKKSEMIVPDYLFQRDTDI